METIFFAGVIVVLAVGAIWFYNRGSGLDVDKNGRVDIDDARTALDNTAAGLREDTRDLRDSVLAQAAESAARAQALIDSKIQRPRAAKSVDKKKAPAAKTSEKNPAVRAKTNRTAKPRAPRSPK